ncbi:MAG: HD domain-containing protein [Symbiobacteriia bacterium]
MPRLTEEKVFKDPVHNYIYVSDQVIWDIVGTPAFQRLRRIRQLGTSYLTYHGAEHSRFAHALGAYELMRRVLSHFHRNTPDWPQDQRLWLLGTCAALTHDLGHGPFSHALERVFGANHEDWTLRILLEDRQVSQVLASVDERFGQDVADVIAGRSPHKVLTSLISSQLDVDRIDYLIRDAVATGVNYGKLELDRLIRTLRPYRPPGAASGTDGDLFVVIKKSGVHTVEQYILARYFMYVQVYLHPVTRGSDILLNLILDRALQLHRQGRLADVPRRLRPLFDKPTEKLEVAEYLALDESLLTAAFAEWQHGADAVLADLTNRFLDRRLYEYFDYPADQPELWQDLQAAAVAAGLDPGYHLAVDRIAANPYYHYMKGITVLDERGGLSDLALSSPLVRALTAETAVYQRLYVAQDLIPAGAKGDRLRSLLQSLRAQSRG